jgi:hypothetical protein
MSREDYSPGLRAVLDRFDAPAPRAAFAERMMAVATPVSRPAMRDRRGGWKLARRAIIGTVVAGMVSAAAVASGLLGATGIRVPVLSAMLAPAPDPAPIPKAKPKPRTRLALGPKPTVVPTKPADPGLSDPGPLVDAQAMQTRTAAAMVRRAERRTERHQFIRQNPELVPVIKQAMQQEKAFVRANPDVRELRRLPPAARKAYLAERPELQAAVRAWQAERRAFRAANPQAVAIMRARAEQRRAAMKPAPLDPALDGNSDVAR